MSPPSSPAPPPSPAQVTASFATPRPVTVDVCQICRLLWSDHEDRARREFHAGRTAGVEVGPHPRDPTLLDCVELLKLDRRGPAGLPGRDAPGGARVSL